MAEVKFLKQKLDREQLDEFARQHGVESPESLDDKTKVAEAVADSVSEEDVEAFLEAEEPEETTETTEDGTTREEALEDGHETAKANADVDEGVSGAERDGTAEFEKKENALEARKSAVEVGRETARKNAKAEREANA